MPTRSIDSSNSQRLPFSVARIRAQPDSSNTKARQASVLLVRSTATLIGATASTRQTHSVTRNSPRQLRDGLRGSTEAPLWQGSPFADGLPAGLVETTSSSPEVGWTSTANLSFKTMDENSPG